MLLVAGSDDALRPFRATRATFVVDSLAECRERVVARGATVLEEPKRVPTGWNMRVRHPEGTVVEYVQHTM